jgi:tetratricopeptide (TPR) repeat protein
LLLEEHAMVSEPTLVESSLFPRLVVKTGGRVIEEVELRGDLTIGRAEDNDLQLTDPKASRHHAHLEQEGSVFVLTDLGSANGTRVNGLLVAEPHPLEHGDRIDIGDTELTYQEPGRALQDTIPGMEGVPTIEAPMATELGGAVPPQPLPAVSESRGGASRGLMVGLILVAAVVILGIAALTVYLLAPDVYEQIGWISPPTATATAMTAASPTPPGPADTPAATPAATIVTATPEISSIDPQEMDDLLDQAEALNRRSKFEESVAIYESLTSRAPDDARPEIGWAWALVLDDQAEEALPHAQRAVELDPTSSAAAAVLSRTHTDLSDEAEALTWGEKAIELEPGNAQARAALAEAHMINGQTQQAVDEADLALVQDINSADAHRIRGWLYHVLDNDMGRAASEFQIAAGLQPELWLRRHDLGMLLLEAEDYVTAIMAFQDALSLRPKAVTYSAIGEAYYQLGQYDQARASLQQALSLGIEDAGTYALLAASHAQLDRCEEAETYYEQALELEPSQPLALEAKEICETATPAPTASSTPAASSVTPTVTPTSTSVTTATPTRTPAPAAALGGKIAFPVWNADNAKYDTYLANTDGSGRRLVADQMHQPALSPDGAWLALNGTRTNSEHLILMKSDGTDSREITNFLEDGQPTWPPDGERLAFASTRHGDKQFRIYIIDDVPFGGGTAGDRTLNIGPDDVRGQMPAWTADDRIVFQGCSRESPRNECSGTGLYITSAVPGPHEPKQLTEHPEDTAPAVYGSRIAFMSNRDGTWEIYVMGIDGTGVRRLTNNAANDGLPTWSPDGRTLAFISNQGGPWAVWAMSPTGSNRRKLFNIGGERFDWLHERISWSQ